MINAKRIVVGLPLLIILLEVFFGVSSVCSGIEKKTLMTLFMVGWMVLWWIFEILPLGITALIPLFFLPFMDVLPIKKVSVSYANPIIYLFLGGFILARALEKTRLNEYIALYILRLTGKSDRGIVLGFTIATAFLSMWISNTATTVMMVPIGLSVMAFLKSNVGGDRDAQLKSMGIVLFLSIAYSANIGGIMTPVGTPPNVVLMGYLEDFYKINVDFWRWMLFAVPVASVLF